MPLDKITLIEDIKNAEELSKKAETLEDAKTIFATNLADAFEKYVKSGDVETTGTATAQTGKIV